MPISNGGGGGGGGSQAVFVETIGLSSAEILALDSTPKTLVAGVPGQVILPVLFLGSITPSTPYSDNPGGRVFLGPTFGTSGFGALLSTPILGLTATTPHMGTTPSPFSDASEATGACVGQPLRLDIVSAVTGGDGTATVSVLYVLIDG